ncbi:MAG TPA: peptide ABC transporter substrate-binding protein [Rhizomicrobium sp.]|nr:peptide ABC transporter substrate-binding protein [Rhizomicrobium sp.]
MKAVALGLMVMAAAPQPSAAAVLNRGNGGEPESLDPAFAGSAAEGNILGDLMVGLTTHGAGGKPIPGIAESWDVSRDGLSWTFHLRKALWSDGRTVTAGDFVFAWRRLLDPRTGARGAANLWVVKNARAISKGAMPADALGVAAPAPQTLTVTLDHPAPYLPELLTNASALPLPSGAVKPGWAMPGRYVSDGPYILKAWVPNDHITLMKNPRFYDAASVRIDAVNYYPTPDTQGALRRLRAGELDMQTPLPTAQIAWMRVHMPDALHIMPSQALAYLAFNLRDPALADIRVRRALSLVYDREAVAGKVLKLGERPAYSYVPPGTANYPDGPQMDFRPMPYPARLALAQRLMQQAGYGPFNRLRLTYATTGNPDSKRLAAVFQAMARQIYADVRIETSDYQVMLRAMRQGQFQIAYTTWLADYDDAGNFLDQLRSNSAGNYAGYRDPKYDALMDAAEHEPDTVKRAVLFRTAERMALAAMPWLPIRFLSQSEAVGPRVGGYIPNRRDINRSRWLWIK